MKTAVLVSPVKPKLLKELPLWSGIIDDRQLELDECRLQDGDFSNITHLQADGSQLVGLNLSSLSLEKCELTDVLLNKVECIGLKAPEASWLRVETSGARMTGADFGASHFEDCVFKDLKLDEAGFRFASFKRVRFEQCILRKADFSNARLQHVTFIDCDFEGINFASMSCASVDVRGQNLSAIKGVHGLKNATITNEQLIQLAPLLAAELNFNVDN